MQDNFYKLIYEVKYNPVKPSIGNEQVSAETPVVKLLSVYLFIFFNVHYAGMKQKTQFCFRDFCLICMYSGTAS